MSTRPSCNVVCRQLRIETLVRRRSARRDALDRAYFQHSVLFFMRCFSCIFLVPSRINVPRGARRPHNFHDPLACWMTGS